MRGCIMCIYQTSIQSVFVYLYLENNFIKLSFETDVYQIKL